MVDPPDGPSTCRPSRVIDPHVIGPLVKIDSHGSALPTTRPSATPEVEAAILTADGRHRRRHAEQIRPDIASMAGASVASRWTLKIPTAPPPLVWEPEKESARTGKPSPRTKLTSPDQAGDILPAWNPGPPVATRRVRGSRWDLANPTRPPSRIGCMAVNLAKHCLPLSVDFKLP